MAIGKRWKYDDVQDEIIIKYNFAFKQKRKQSIILKEITILYFLGKILQGLELKKI